MKHMSQSVGNRRGQLSRREERILGGGGRREGRREGGGKGGREGGRKGGRKEGREWKDIIQGLIQGGGG